MPNMQIIVASSAFSGFKNYLPIPGITTISIPATTLTAGTSTAFYVKVTTLIPMNNANAISTVKVQFATSESFWHQAIGFVQTPVISGQYSLTVITSYSGGNLVVDVYIANQTGPNATITVPAQTIYINPRLYESPF